MICLKIHQTHGMPTPNPNHQSLLGLPILVSTPHLHAIVDTFEMNYHHITGHIIRTRRNDPPTMSQPANIQYIAAAPEYLPYLSHYDEEQGNGDGPAV